jgi:hypothetical protein
MHRCECTTEEEKRKLIKEAVNKFCPVPKDDEGELFYRTAVVLVAAVWEAPEVTRLADLTGYSKEVHRRHFPQYEGGKAMGKGRGLLRALV